MPATVTHFIRTNSLLAVMVLITLGAMSACNAAGAAVQPTNSPVQVHWWVVNTPVGSVGYSDSVYMFDAPASDGEFYRGRYIYLGPVGRFRTGLSGPGLCTCVGIGVALLLAVIIGLVAKKGRRHEGPD